MTDESTGAKEAQQNDAVDDRGTNQGEGRTLLKNLRDQGFDSNDEQLAVALGRPVEEVAAWMNGREPVDDDVIMKARGLATERGISIE
ncbi:MAG TPA: hypothetical protein VF779_06550 [Pyrinomonadaceae bacterium]